MAIIIETCEHCGGKNDRAAFANWCQKCADEYERNRKRQQAEREAEFLRVMDGRPA